MQRSQGQVTLPFWISLERSSVVFNRTFCKIVNATTTINDAGEKRYFVDTEADIIAILQILASENVPLTIFQVGDTQLASIRILAVNPERKCMILDGRIERALADGMCNTDGLHVCAYQQPVKIDFKLQRASRMLYQGNPALHVRIPFSLVGTERRDNYRAKTDDLTVATLLIPISNQPEPLSCRIVDISTGGCAFEVAATSLRIDPGTILGDCILDMLGIGKLVVAIEIRHSSDMWDGSELAKRRYGCRFTNLNSKSGDMIQSYMGASRNRVDDFGSL